MRALNSSALIALLLAGCGGGGGSDAPADVSANPPAPVAAAPEPEPVPPSSTPAPDATPTPAPVATTPSPVTDIPPAPPDPAPEPPGAPPAVHQPAPVRPTVSAEFVSRALGMRITGPVGTNTTGMLQAEAPLTLGYISQDWHFGGPSYAFDPGTHWHASGSTGNLSGNPRRDLEMLRISTTNDPIVPVNGSYSSAGIGPHMVANSIQLERDEPVAFRSDPPLNATVAEWRPVDKTQPWFVQLQLQSDQASDTVFRVCWHVRLPSIIRLSCTKFDRLTGEFRGVHIVDDSYGLGPLIWTTQ